MAVRAVSDAEGPGDARVRVTLLGPFTIRLGERSAGPWYRPPAKRLCELVMVSPGLRVGREVARELLFADLGPAASANALSRALSLAREALSALGEEVAERLRADRAHIWFSAEAPLDIDLVAHEEALRSALAMEPGGPRDAALSKALAEDGVLLEDEPYADWALRPREALELVRQRARLELARDRARGRGRSAPEAVIEAWEDCLAHDPASEEAASSLMRVYAAQGHRQAVAGTYERCRCGSRGLGSTGLAGAGRGPTSDRGDYLPRSGRASEWPPRPPPAAQGRAEAGERAVRRALRAGGHGPQVGPRGPAPARRRGLGGRDRRGGGARRDGHLGVWVPAWWPFSAPRRPTRTTPSVPSGPGPASCAVAATGSHGPEAGTLSVRVGIESGPAVVGPRRRGRLWGGGGSGGRGRLPTVGGQSGLCAGRPGHPCRHREDLRVGAD